MARLGSAGSGWLSRVKELIPAGGVTAPITESSAPLPLASSDASVRDFPRWRRPAADLTVFTVRPGRSAAAQLTARGRRVGRPPARLKPEPEWPTDVRGRRRWGSRRCRRSPRRHELFGAVRGAARLGREPVDGRLRGLRRLERLATGQRDAQQHQRPQVLLL